MKAPDLSAVESAGLVSWSGATESLKTAAAHANLRFSTVDLAKAKDRATLFAELDRALALPDHFGHNWDAFADVLEDRDWLGKRGIVIVLAHASAWKKVHPHEWATLDDLLEEAAEFWKERNVAFWVFVS